METETTTTTNDGGQTTAPPAGFAAPGALDLPPDLVKNSPEYRELQRQNRILARQAGEAAKQADEARARQAAAEQAAEAERVAAQENQIRELLGEEGVQLWTQLSEASENDPVEAAKLLKQILAGAQSPAAGQGQDQSTEKGNTVSQQQQPPAAPALSRTVGADAPLAGASGDETTQVIEQLEKRYASVVERNQDPSQRNRVTMRDRADAVIAYVGAAYLKSGARPKS